MAGNGCRYECMMREKCKLRSSEKLFFFSIVSDTHLYICKSIFQLIFPSVGKLTVVPDGESCKQPSKTP